MFVPLRNIIFKALLKLLLKRKGTIAESRARIAKSAKLAGKTPEAISVEKLSFERLTT